MAERKRVAVWLDDTIYFCTGPEGGGTALVFSVRPSKVFAFAKGTFSQTRHLF